MEACMTISFSEKRFEDNPSIKGREERFTIIIAKVDLILASWRNSLFAHEWMNGDGSLKAAKAMSVPLQKKRMDTERLIASDTPLPRPVLGIGIADNVEIGSGRDLFLTLAAQGVKDIPVHIPKSNLTEFRMFSSSHSF